MKTITVSTRLSPGDLADLEEAAIEACMDRASMTKTLLRRGLSEARNEMAEKSYREGKVTLSRAAEIARMSLWDFQQHLAQKYVPSSYDLDELEEDLKHVAEQK